MSRVDCKLSFVLLSFSFICGCTAKYTYQPPLESKLKQGQEARLVKGKGVAVLVPKNGEFELAVYERSGMYTAESIKEALKCYTSDVSIISKSNENDIFLSIDSKKYSYVFKPEIIHWEERATEWSGKPDRIEIKITVYDAKNHDELSSQMFFGKSKWFTFGGDHPQDLLTVPIKKYVNSLYKQ